MVAAQNKFVNGREARKSGLPHAFQGTGDAEVDDPTWQKVLDSVTLVWHLHIRLSEVRAIRG
jgi:hypothetical protein